MTRTARRRTKKSFLPETSFSEMVAHQDKTNSDAQPSDQKGAEGDDYCTLYWLKTCSELR